MTVVGLLILLIAFANAPAQTDDGQTKQPNGAISGIVRNGLSGKPIPRAVVALRSSGSGAPLARIVRQLTDEQGRFVFRALAPFDNYTLTATKLGYVEGSYGQRAMSGPPGAIALTDGLWFGKADILLWKPGAIGGRVFDEHREPLVGVYVRVLAQQHIAGQRKLVGGPAAKTDDRGEYRIAGLPPGTYLVSVPSAQNTVPAGTPAGPTLDEITSSDALATQLMFNSLGAPPRGDARLDLDPAARLVVGNYATPPPPSGGRTFAYPMAFHPGATSPASASSVTLGLAEERTGVDISVQPVATARVSGSVEGPAEVISRLLLRLVPVGLEELATGSEAATTIVAADGRFTFLNVPRGAYAIDARRSTTEFVLEGGVPGAVLPSPPGISGGGSSNSGTFPSAPPGTGYITRSRSGDDRYWTSATVTVDAANVENLVVTLHPGLRLSGRMVFEGSTRAIVTAPMAGGGAVGPGGVTTVRTPPPATLPVVQVEPAGGDPTLGRHRSEVGVDATTTDRFAIEGLRPGEYVLRVPARADQFSIRSITIGGEDYTHKPFDPATVRGLDDVVLTFTDRLTTLQGAVRDERGPVDDAAVIAFPVEREQWIKYGFSPVRVRATPLSGTSKFVLRGLPAGAYFLIAVDPSLITAWQDPAFLDRAAGLATRVSLDWGGTATVDLQTARIK